MNSESLAVPILAQRGVTMSAPAPSGEIRVTRAGCAPLGRSRGATNPVSGAVPVGPRCLRGALLALALSALAGCAMGPDYHQPDANLPATYKEATPTAGAPHAGAENPIAADWWRAYHDPVLDSLIVQVRVNNQTVAAAAARVQAAQDQLKVAGGQRWPQLFAGTIHSARSNQNDFGLGLSWELDFWGRIRRDVEAHRANAQASADELAAATLSLQAQVAQAYFTIREQDAATTIQQQTAAAARQAHTIAANQYARGQASSADVAESQLRLNAAEQQIAELQRTRARLEHALATLLGKAPADFALAPAPFDTAVPAVPAGVPATLLTRRPDIAARERQLAAASARIGVSEAERLPTIKLLAGLGILDGGTATAGINWPLFTGGSAGAVAGGARAAYVEAEANWRQSILDALREVDDGLVDERTLAQAATLQDQAVRAAREAERVARNQHREGFLAYPEVMVAVDAASKAEQGALQLRLRRLNASVDLTKALGGGWRTPAPHVADEVGHSPS